MGSLDAELQPGSLGFRGNLPRPRASAPEGSLWLGKEAGAQGFA